VVLGREIHMEGMRGRWFGQLGLITAPGPGDAVANIWNTAGACDPASSEFDALHANAIASENILRDNLHNLYQGTDIGRSFSDKGRQDSLW
jgi:hypothetical protein